MTLPELLAGSILTSILVAAAGWLIGQQIERRIADPVLRERVWATALYLPLLPVLVVPLLLLLPAPVVRIEIETVEAAATMLNGSSPMSAGFSVSALTASTAAAGLTLAILLTAARFLRLARRALRLRRLMRATRPAGHELQQYIAGIARGLGVPAPAVRLCPSGSGTFLTGLQSPVLVLPSALAATPVHPAARAICAHELAHLKRGDHRALWAEEFLLTILAINPVLRFIRQRREAAREEACDAIALAGSDSDTRRLYARALLAALREPLRLDDVPALTFISPKRTFAMLRLKAILAPTPAAAPRVHQLSIALGAVIAAGVCGGSVALAAQREPVMDVHPIAPAMIAAKTVSTPVAAPIASVRPVAAETPAVTTPSARPAPAEAPTPRPTPVQDNAAQPAVITNPNWVQHPMPRFPAAAAEAGVTEGRVGLNCAANASGRLTNCTVTSEDPVGSGFGEAALTAAREARLSPQTADTASTGARVAFAVRFRSAD